MKLMRLLTLFAACLFALATLAQQNPPAKEGQDHNHMGSVDDHVKELSSKLNLTADQQAKVKSILEGTHQQMETLMKDQSLSKEDKHAKMKSMHESVHAQVREVLTADQKPKFDAMVKDMDDHTHKHQGGGDNNSPK